MARHVDRLRNRLSHLAILGTLLLAVPGFACTSAGADPVDEDAAIRAVALEMPRSIDYGDWDGFIGLFTEDAVMYYPFAAERANTRIDIAAVMKPIFDRNRQAGEGPYFGFEASEVLVRRTGPTSAAVTWVMDGSASVARRTALLRKEAGVWKIHFVHADTFRKAG